VNPLPKKLPQGFRLKSGDDGSWTLVYRTRASGFVAACFIGWFAGWTAGCLMTRIALFNTASESYLNSILIVPFWAAELLVAGYLAWFFWSITRFTFNADVLAIDWSLLGCHRRRAIRRAEVRQILVVKDGEGCDAKLPIWSLAMVTDCRVSVLKHQTLDRCTWIGRILARWADVRFESD
jgi:hypothetical protein